MLKNGFIKDTVNKETFSEQCYYQFGTNPNISDGKYQSVLKHLSQDIVLTNFSLQSQKWEEST